MSTMTPLVPLRHPNSRGLEMGIARKIALTPEGRSRPLYAGKPNVFCC